MVVDYASDLDRLVEVRTQDMELLEQWECDDLHKYIVGRLKQKAQKWDKFAPIYTEEDTPF